MNFRLSTNICERTECELWRLIGEGNLGQQSPLILSQNRRTLLLDKIKRGPLVGVVPFYIESFSPLTVEATNNAYESLSEALMWCGKQSDFPPRDSRQGGDVFAHTYLLGALEMAQSSAVGATVSFGLDSQVAKLMNLNKVNQWAIEVFMRHYTMRFQMMGYKEYLHEDFPNSVLVALSDALEASWKKWKNCREVFLKRLFRANGFNANIPFAIAGCESEKEELKRVLQMCSELSVRMQSTTRLLQLLGADEKEAYNMARRGLPQNKDRKNVKYRARSNRSSLNIQIAKALLERALQRPCSVPTLIETWMWACLNAIRILRVHGVVGHEGFWITWFEKRMKDYLRELVVLDDDYSGARVCRSAKNNVMRGE